MKKIEPPQNASTYIQQLFRKHKEMIPKWTKTHQPVMSQKCEKLQKQENK